jgi:hypothetical protein
VNDNKKPISGTQSDTFIDPKSQFLFKLNERVSEINKELFSGNPSSAAYKMSVTIQSLDIPDKPEFAQIRMLQEKWLPNHYNISPFRTESFKHGLKTDEIFVIWRLFSACLNATYFKGWSNIAPRKSDEPKLGEP